MFSSLLGVPPHRLDMQVGVSVMSLQNLETPWLCDGTRLMVNKNVVVLTVVKPAHRQASSTFFWSSKTYSKPSIQFFFLELRSPPLTYHLPYNSILNNKTIYLQTPSAFAMIIKKAQKAKIFKWLAWTYQIKVFFVTGSLVRGVF